MFVYFPPIKHSLAPLDGAPQPERSFSVVLNSTLLFRGGLGSPQGTPEIKEHYIDSKKDVDRHLKFSCEQFIQQQTQIFVGNLEEFLTRVTGAGAEVDSAPRQQLTLIWFSFIYSFFFLLLSRLQKNKGKG